MRERRNERIRFVIVGVSVVAMGLVVVSIWYILPIVTFMWTGLEKRVDVTDQPHRHGGFEIGGCYRLKHGVYLYDSGNSDILALNAPERYSFLAFQTAVREVGIANAIAGGWQPGDETDWNDPPTVESLQPGDIPTQFKGVIPAGTRLRIERIEHVTGGDRSSLSFYASILEGTLAGTAVLIDPMTTYGLIDVEKSASGYWPNPLILEASPCGPE